MEAHNLRKIEAAVSQILDVIGDDPSRQGLRQTPKRVAESLSEMLAGYNQHPAEHLEAHLDVKSETANTHGAQPTIGLEGILFTSLCEHHLLPFSGAVHIAYLPGSDGRIAGFSNLARVVDGFASRLQMQERLTAEIADTISSSLNAAGTLVVIKASHACVTARGPRKEAAVATTSVALGKFETNDAARAEALTLLGLQMPASPTVDILPDLKDRDS